MSEDGVENKGLLSQYQAYYDLMAKRWLDGWIAANHPEIELVTPDPTDDE